MQFIFKSAAELNHASVPADSWAQCIWASGLCLNENMVIYWISVVIIDISYLTDLWNLYPSQKNAT
jgi:hypothetical protein